MVSFATKVPEGTYQAAETPEQIVAMKLTQKIGSRLAQEHPEIADLYRQGGNFARCIDIAREYFPEDPESHMEVCKKAVTYALGLLMPEAERAKIRKERKLTRMETWFKGGFEGEAFREHCRKARMIKEIKGIRTDMKLLIEGRGQIPWTEEERSALLNLIKNPDFQWKWGIPNFGLIAEEINKRFHDRKEVRTQKSVGNYNRDLTRKQKKRNPGA